MDHLSRLIVWLLGWVSLCFWAVVPLSAHAYQTVPLGASVPGQSRYIIAQGTGAGCTGNMGSYGSPPAASCGTSAQGAANNWMAYWVGVYGSSTQNCGTSNGGQQPIHVANVSETSAELKYDCTDYSHNLKGPVTISHDTGGVSSGSCPSNSTIAPDGQCVCNGGFKASGGSCVAAVCPSSGAANILVQVQQVSSLSLSLCNSGCVVRGVAAAKAQDGRYWAFGPYAYTGGACEDVADGEPAGTTDLTPSPWDGNSSNDAPLPCGAGKCPGTVNGASVCVACSSTTTQGTSSSSTGASGASTGSSSQQTTCDGVNCTTTTTTTDSNGNVTGTTSSTGSQAGFCKDNPTSPQCTPSTFSGTCAATTCTGDAVQCAIAAEQARRDCQLFDTSTPESQAYDAAKVAGAQPSDHPGNPANVTNVDMSQGFNQSDILSGACPGDYTVATVRGSPVVIQFSKLCTAADWLGNLLVGLTALACVGIVFVKGS